MQPNKKEKDYTGYYFLCFKHPFFSFPGDCSEKQLKALDDFRKIAQSKGCQNPPYDDAYLLRFLRARKFEVEKTTLMFNDFLKWRQDNDVDNVSTYMFTELAQVRQFYPHGYHKTDKQGRPIYIERIGLLQLNKLFEITSEQRLIKYYIQSYETLLKRIFPACTQARGQRVDQTLTILDLKGGSMKMVSKQVYNFIQLASKIGQDNYPEILGKMFIINAPMLFSGIWAMIKVWLDEKTKNKITILGSSYKEELLKFIEIDNLPDFLGGTSKCEGTDLLYRNVGPWNPQGKQPLFPVELPAQEEQEDDEQDEQMQLAQLKNALANMIQNPQEKAPHNPEKHELTTQQNHQVSDTPLNTEAVIKNIYMKNKKGRRHIVIANTTLDARLIKKQTKILKKIKQTIYSMQII